MIQLSDRFVLQREIGSGGMSRVFLGRDETLDRPVAVKVLKTGYAGTEIGARFRREGRTAAKLSHPNIVQVYDAGEGEFEGEEASFIVMEYVSGGDLKALIDERGTLSGDQLSTVGAEVAAGLAHAHERGVIHRDVKPHNILLEEGGRARLTDFGIARALDVTQVTQTGFYLGTALYSSPEQLRGEGVTPKSDVYSLGATLYQAATGEPPFAGAPIEVASQHVSREPTPPREINPEVSGTMEALILRCMSKDPDSRPTTDEARITLLEAGRGAHATRAYTEAPAEESVPRRASPVPSPASTPRQGRRRRRRGALLALLGLAAVLAVIGALAASSLLGGGEESAGSGGGQDAQSNGQANDEPAGSGQGEGGQNSGGQEPSGQQTATQQASEKQTAAQQTATQTASSQAQSAEAGSSEDPPDGTGSDESDDPAEEAERAVEEFYSSSVQRDFDGAYGMLSTGWRQAKFPSQAVLEGTFAEVEDVTFIEGPTAEVSGDTATVTGTTRAELTTRTERNEGTWFLVNENGEWLIDEWDVNLISVESA